LSSTDAPGPLASHEQPDRMYFSLIRETAW